MMQPTMPFSFDRSKPFYPLVMTYIAQLHGFIELVSRGAILRLQAETATPDQLASHYAQDPKRGQLIAELKASGLTKLIGEMQFPSRVENKNIELDMNELGIELFMQGTYIIPFFARYSSGVLLIAAWEI